MIYEPVNDAECLGRLTTMARELVRTTLARNIAEQLGSPAGVVRWLQSLPQSDDDGSEEVQGVQCDVWQRLRLFPSRPNCFERSFAALVLNEVLDPSTPRALVSIERPARHTAIVEQRGDTWQPIDLFPRRNALGLSEAGPRELHGAHEYVGKPALKFYLGDTGGHLAAAVAEQDSDAAASPRQAGGIKLPTYGPRGWRGGDEQTLYAFIDKRTGQVSVRPVYAATGIGPEVTVRVATQEEAEQGWQSPLHAGWRVAAPSRNMNWGEFGKDVLQGTHQYVGKPILGAYGLGGIADSLGDVENQAIGRPTKPPPAPPRPAPSATATTTISAQPTGRPGAQAPSESASFQWTGPTRPPETMPQQMRPPQRPPTPLPYGQPEGGPHAREQPAAPASAPEWKAADDPAAAAPAPSARPPAETEKRRRYWW